VLKKDKNKNNRASPAETPEPCDAVPLAPAAKRKKKRSHEKKGLLHLYNTEISSI
jgi:hypothetical protein